MPTTYTATCRQDAGDSPRWYLESDGWEPQMLGQAGQFDSDLLVQRLAAGYIAQRLGFTVTGLDHLIKEGLAPGGSWTAAGYTGAYPVYQVTVPDLYLSGTECAARVGVRPKTWSSYVARGYTPEPDARIGDVMGWLPATVDGWVRPGQGARTDRETARLSRS